jgi:hypothetical protein
MMLLVLGCGGPSAAPTDKTDKADVKTPSFGPSGDHPVVSEEPKPSEDQKLADQIKAETVKKVAEDATRWPALQAKAADPKATADQTAAGNAEADRLLAEDKAAAAKVAQQPPVDSSVSQQSALDRANALIKTSAEKVGKDKKTNDKNWQAPPVTKTADTPPAPKPEPKVEKKSPSNKPAGKKPAEKKPVDE